MTSETYQRLCAEMPTHKRPDGLDYISGEQVISRLNDVLGPERWHFTVKEHGIHTDADEVWVLGRFEARFPGLDEYGAPRDIVHEQFGSQKLKRRKRPSQNDPPGDILDLGFDLKGAATDALKKCATHIGVGLWMYEKDAPKEAPKRPAAPTPTSPRPPAAAPAAKDAFRCDECKQEYQSVRTNEAVYPAADWLAKLKERGVTNVVCFGCAASGKAKKAAPPEAAG